MMDKRVSTAAEAVAGLGDGATLGISGFGASHGFPVDLVEAASDLQSRDLTLVCNSLGITEEHPLRLVQRGRVGRLVASFSARAGIPDSSAQQASPVPLEVELVPQGILVERLRAAGAGIGPFYSPVGVDTELVEGRETRSFGDRTYVLEHPLKLDVALIYAAVADAAGNVSFRGTSRNFGPSFAKAADLVLVQADEIVEIGELRETDINLPGVFVDRVVPSARPRASRWTSRERSQERRELFGKQGRSSSEIGARVAALIPDGSYVNLGVGLPTQVSDHIAGRDIALHAENGALGYGERVHVDVADLDAYNAGGEPIRLTAGTSVFDSVEAFEIARGGHLDAVVLGAFEADETGSFANWTTPSMGGGAIGGAMDLLVAPGRLILAMRHAGRDGSPKIVERCRYACTGREVVDLIVTDLAVIERDERGLVLRETAPGFTVEEVASVTGASLEVELW